MVVSKTQNNFRGNPDPESSCNSCGCGDSFPTSPSGFIKLGELILAVVCQFLLLHYGVEYLDRLSVGFLIFLTCNSGVLITSFVYIICYTVSTSTYNTVRSSLVEMLQNVLFAVLYISSSVMLVTSVITELYYLYHTVTGFSAYPALTAVYLMGFLAFILQIIDAILAFALWRKQNNQKNIERSIFLQKL